MVEAKMATECPRCFGVFGHPIFHSRSPAMHNAALSVLGLPHRYLAFDVSPRDLSTALLGAQALGFGGINLTVPHKQAVIPMLDVISDEAHRIGAVNTVAFVDGKRVGHNTDGRGFLAGLRELGDASVRHATVLGAGGASRAVVDALRAAFPDATLRWVSRAPERVVVSYDRVHLCSYDELDQHDLGDLLVNTTTVGMPEGPTEFPVPIDLTRTDASLRVIDLVYTPTGSDADTSTPLVGTAERLGLLTQDGLPMLLWQGVFALATWLGTQLDADVVSAMRGALK